MNIYWRPGVPYRGEVAHVADRIALFASVFMMLTLLPFVVDARLLCRRFIQKLARGRTEWPTAPLAAAKIERGIDADLAGEWLDIQLITRRTRVIGKLVIYPFVVLLLLLVSRNSFFDRWSWPLSLIVVFAINALLALMSAFVLRRAAEEARRQSIGRLTGTLLQHQGAGRGAQADQTRTLIEEIASLREGAFAPLAQHPVFSAMLMPFGGVSIAVLLEILSGSR